MVNYGISEDGRLALEDLCGDGRVALNGFLIEDGRSILVYMVFSSDTGMGSEAEKIWIYLLLKLLQKKGLNMELSQKKKGLNIELSQEGGQG